MTKRFIACILLLPCFLLVSCTKMKTLPPEMSMDAPVTAAPWISGKSAAAFMVASAAQKHFFLYLYAPGKNDAKIKKIFDGSVQKLGNAAQAYTLNIKDASENALVQKFRLQQAPMPLVLVFAPNGAIMGGFPKERINEATLLNVITTTTFQRCLLALQEGKIVLVCAVKSDASKKGPQVPKGVLDFYNDPQYKDRVKVVAVDPSSTTEKTLMSQLRIDPNAKEATTCILVPPGSMVATLSGSVKEKDIVNALTKGSAGRGPGGPGGQGGPGGPGGQNGQGGPSNASVPPPNNPPQK